MWVSVFKEETTNRGREGRGPTALFGWLGFLFPGEVCPSAHPQIFTRMGQCYTFNSGANGAELLTTPKGGAGNGLEVMLDVQEDEYLPVWKDVGTRVRVAAGVGHQWGADVSGEERRCWGGP